MFSISIHVNSTKWPFHGDTPLINEHINDIMSLDINNTILIIDY